MIVQVAINIPVDHAFSYSVPPDLEDAAVVGKRVLVPFGKKKLTGYIISKIAEPDRKEIKSVVAILDQDPLFSKEDLDFFQWASDYYQYPIGRLLKEVLPGGIDTGSDIRVFLNDSPSFPEGKLSPLGKDLLAFLQAHPQGISLRRIKKAFENKRIDQLIKRLHASEWIRLEEHLTRPAVSAQQIRFVLASDEAQSYKLTPGQAKLLAFLRERGEMPVPELRSHFKNSDGMLKRLMDKGCISIQEREILRCSNQKGIEPASGAGQADLILNQEQDRAVEALRTAISVRQFSTHLLHGVTGSGKTEVYLRAMEEVLIRGGSIIYLVPEIALTPQLLGRVRARFAEYEIAVMHSEIPESVRYDQWRRIRRGEIRIILGARSAVFAPARGLGLIIVDEEHDTSYKQDDRLRYNARDLAVVKAKRFDAVVVLGSATPAVQTYHHALNGKYHYISLPKRVEGRALPAVHIVDMKGEIDTDGRPRIISRPLLDGIREMLDRRMQGMLFLNRRGFHTFLCCYTCGHVFKCLNCSVSLTHHATEGVLRCHYCDFSLKAIPLCPVCGEGRIGTFGSGTERLEKEIAERFPAARTARMDSDTTAGKGRHEKILKQFSIGEIDLLIGTQMITKGHDFPNVLLVGIISADAALNLPDFRSSEKTFQVITQVAGRGGRGDVPGRVYIQTFNPEQYAIQNAAQHDYRGFYDREIALRKEFSYPPFSRIVTVQIASNARDKAIRVSEEIGRLARRFAAGSRIDIMGPADAPIARIKGRYRRHLLLKGRSSEALHTLIRNVLERKPERDVTVQVDFDPVNFM